MYECCNLSVYCFPLRRYVHLILIGFFLAFYLLLELIILACLQARHDGYNDTYKTLYIYIYLIAINHNIVYTQAHMDSHIQVPVPNQESK